MTENMNYRRQNETCEVFENLKGWTPEDGHQAFSDKEERILEKVQDDISKNNPELGLAEREEMLNNIIVAYLADIQGVLDTFDPNVEAEKDILDRLKEKSSILKQHVKDSIAEIAGESRR